MAPARYESKWRPIKTNCRALRVSHETHTSTLRMALTKWINRIAINGDDKRLSIKWTTRNSFSQQRLCWKNSYVFSNQAFTANIRQKKVAHGNNCDGCVGSRPVQLTAFQEDTIIVQSSPALVFMLNTQRPTVCLCVFWGRVRGWGKELKVRSKFIHGHDTWASIWHKEKPLWRLHKHCHFFVSSQRHLGQSLRIAQSWTFYLYIMLTFFLSQVLLDIWYWVDFTTLYSYYTVNFLIFYLPDYAFCPHFISKLFSSFFPPRVYASEIIQLFQ